MDDIVLTGSSDATTSFELSRRLEAVTCSLRPAVTVDLSDVDDLHPSVVSVLIRQRRQARRQRGDLRLIAPRHPEARRTLHHIGLIGARR